MRTPRPQAGKFALTNALTRALTLALALLTLDSTAAGGQTVQYRSPAGVVYRSTKDTGAVARAERALAADPKNVSLIIALGTAQAGVRDMRSAITTFTKGLESNPTSALLYRWRGHRHLSVREFDQAEADFARGLQLDSTVYGIWYHLGIIRFLKGDFNGAADAFKRAQPRAPDGGELAGSTDWLWMSLSRAGKHAEAQAMLDRKPDTLKVDPEYAYAKRLRLYRQQTGPDLLFVPSDTADTQVATLSYGRANWHIVMGDTATAKRWFRKAIDSGAWPAFGFIVAEAELRRLR